jgi:trigger factor
MEIQIKELEPCKLNIVYVADAGEILEKRGLVLQAFKKAPVPGFRPGKGSLDAIKFHYKSQIEESLKRGLAENAYHNTLFEKKLRPHGAPFFKELLMGDGKFTCEFDLFVKPDFELANFKNMEVPKPHEDVSVVEFAEKILQDLRLKFGDTAPYTDSDFVQQGDNVIIDYVGIVEGVKVDSLCAEGEMLTIGQSQLLNFDSSLLGMSLGETREFDLVVPENGMPSLAGKTVHFVVTLNMGSKTELCALDDSLAKKMGKETILELRELVNAAATGRVSNTLKLKINEAVASRLVNDNGFEVPNWLSLSEAQYLAHSAKLDWVTMEESDKERYLEMATKNVKLSLVLDKIRETEPEAQLSDQEVFDIIKTNLVKTQNSKESVDDIIKEMNRTGYLQIMFSRIKDEYTLDFVSKKISIVE